MSKNILLFCEDYFGTGHIKRALNILHKIIEQDTLASVYLLYGGRLIEGIEICSDIHFYQLTPVETNKNMHFNRSDIKSLSEIRSQEIYDILMSIDDIDVLLVDMYPFTRRPLRFHYRFLMDSAKKLNPKIKIASYIRDVEEPFSARTQCKILLEISKYIDMVFICGEREINDALISSIYLRSIEPLTEHVGFVVAEGEKKDISMENNGFIIKFIISVGAGRDGYEIQKEVLKNIIPFLNVQNSQVDIFMSEYFNSEQVKKLHSLSRGYNINIHPFSKEFQKYLNDADIHICMGGYNSIAESFQAKVFPIVIPRELNNEQLLRALYLERKGVVACIRQKKLNSYVLMETIEKVLESRHNVSNNFNLDGAQSIARRVLSDEFVSTKNKLDNLCNNIRSLMNINSIKYPLEFISIWNSCLNFALSIQWDEKLLDEYLDITHKSEFFGRAIVLPTHVFNQEFVLNQKDALVYEYTLQLTPQIFEQIYLLRKNGKSNFRRILESMKESISYESFCVLKCTYDLM